MFRSVKAVIHTASNSVINGCKLIDRGIDLGHKGMDICDIQVDGFREITHQEVKLNVARSTFETDKETATLEQEMRKHQAMLEKLGAPVEH